MNFEETLEKGQFKIPKCIECKNIVWPPSDYCPHCFGKIELKSMDLEAKIVEFSKKDDEYFCLVEIKDSFKIIARAKQRPSVGKVNISKCGIKDGDYFFEIS